MIERVTMSEWERLDAAHPAPTLFARPAWARALQSAFPRLEPYPLRARGVTIPFVRPAGGPLHWRALVGFPFGAYTCPMTEDGGPVAAESLQSALDEIAESFDSVRVVLWPLGVTDAARAGWTELQHDTAVIDLSSGADEALRGVAGISRRMAGQAERRGVTCAQSRASDAVDIYYSMLCETAAHWAQGTPSFPKALLEALVEYAGDDVEIWFAKHNGETIAGGVMLYGSTECFFWSAAMRREYSRLRPSNALNVALIRAAAERGVRWYNLGSSEGLPGVERFKRDLGARTVIYTELSHERRAYKMYARLRASLRPRAAATTTITGEAS